ncbi:hypothetical protein [Variovorax paradoxus]|uniref:hypothetical protein n=1 Tax=Variovorax paradoxus TaxID=34073 RepID=UPI001184FDD4|nr:hypothetical protein [Variovorax paradoxus]
MRRIHFTEARAVGSHPSSRFALGAIFAGALLVAGADVQSQPADVSGADTQKRTTVIGYPSVAEAMRVLEETPGSSVTVTEPDRWTIISEPGPTYTQWSFTPAGHYAHPAVVRRGIKIAGSGGVFIETTALCEAQKLSCDKLLDEFRQMNARAKQAVQERLQNPAPR